MINNVSGNNVNFTGIKLANNFTREKLLSTAQQGGESSIAVLNGLSTLDKICGEDEFLLSAKKLEKENKKGRDVYGLQLYDKYGTGYTFTTIENGTGDSKVAKSAKGAFSELASIVAFSRPEIVESALDTYM